MQQPCRVVLVLWASLRRCLSPVSSSYTLVDDIKLFPNLDMRVISLLDQGAVLVNVLNETKTFKDVILLSYYSILKKFPSVCRIVCAK